jgi:uncharacterized protein YvpB
MENIGNEATNQNTLRTRLVQPATQFLGRIKSSAKNIHTPSMNTPRKLWGKITKRTMFLGLFILVGTVVVTFIVAWLVLKITSPEEIIYFFVHLNFDVYAGLMLLLFALLVINNIYQISTKIYDNRFNLKRFLITNVLLVLGIVGLFLGSYVFRHPTLESNYPKYGESFVDYTKPIEVVFNLPVRVSELKPNIVPELVGKWVWEPYLGMSGISRVGHFYPEITAFPDERFILYITGIQKLTDSTSHEYGFIFESPELPRIVRTVPANEAENVKRDEPIMLQIDKESTDMVDWFFEFTPATEIDIEYTESNQILLKPKSVLEQGKEYELEISYKSKKINITTGEVISVSDSVEVDGIKFITAKEPLIDTFFPTGTSVKPSDRIDVKFSEEMNRESVEENFVIEPAVEGEFEWKDDKNFVYQNTEDFQKDTTYKVKFIQGMKSKYDGIVETEALYEFKTVGKVAIMNVSPSHGQTGVSEFTDIRMTFDQDIDKNSAASKLSITPGLAGNISWEGNTLIFDTQQQLSFETNYTVTIEPGVQSVYGTPNDTKLSFGFTVRSNVYVFNIPLFYQPEGSFSCNIYTAMMILAWKGHQSNASGLISEIGYDANRSGNSWTGNPYTEYVGTADGSWGYGVYYQPIQRIFSNRGITSEAKTGWNVSELAQQVQQGRPVVFWRYNGVSSGQDISWTSDDGTYVHAFSGMHGGVVSGFMGPASNPTHLYINDPWFGQFWMDVGSFNYYWSFTNNMAVIVY